MTGHHDVDDFLVAYVDGELDEAGIHMVEADLARNPATHERIEIYRNTAALLKAAFPESRYAGPGLRLPTKLIMRRTRGSARSSWMVAASLLLGIICYGAGVYWPVPLASEGSRMRAEIAEYHEIYARETVHLVEADATHADHIKAWLSARVQRQIVIPNLTEAGLTFAGARLVAIDGHAVAALMYTRGDGLPIAFCIARMKADKDRVVEQHGGISVATWGDGSHLFVVVGEGPTGLIQDIATKVQQQI